MPQKTKTQVTKEREEEALKSYQWNFSGLVHEFNLLHTRAGHYININWMGVAAYIPVFVITLANLGNPQLRLFACIYLEVIAIIGLIATFISIPGTSQAISAVKRYIQNQAQIEKELGNDHSFLSDVSLGRTPDPNGNFHEHETSLNFHKVLPYLLVCLWLTLIGFAGWLYFLPAPIDGSLP